MFVVTGPTGHLGRLVAGELSSRGLRQRVLVRDPNRAPDIAGAEIAMADYGDPESLAGALEPDDSVFMMSLHEGPGQRIPHHRSFIDAAAAAGVAHIVYLSFIWVSIGETTRYLRFRLLFFDLIGNEAY